MERLTRKLDDGTYVVAADAFYAESDGSFAGPAIERLAAYENAAELVAGQLEAVTAKIDALKTQGKTRGAAIQQLLAQKVSYTTMLHLLDGD